MPAGRRVNVRPSEYQREERLNADPSQALETARATLLSHGFQITTDPRGILEAKGPGMNSSKQSALLGVSQLQISASESTVRVVADLGGLRPMRLLLYGLPIGLAVLFLVLFGFSFGFSWGYALPLLPWVVLSPLMARWLEKRTRRALDVLVHNMVAGAPKWEER